MDNHPSGVVGVAIYSKQQIKRQRRITGPITTQETSRQMRLWEKRTRVICQDTSKVS